MTDAQATGIQATDANRPRTNNPNPNTTWLASKRAEAIIEPDLPIIDPHHHLWDRAGNRYLLDELMADISGGHNVLATVFIECSSMYRASGPRETAPIGETEFVNGVAAMSASGTYGLARACDGIVSFADLMLGDRVEDVLQEHIRAGGERFKGIRHAAAWDPSEQIAQSHTKPRSDMFTTNEFRSGFARLQPLGLTFEAWLYHPQLGEFADLAAAFPDTKIVLNHVGGPLGVGAPYAGRRDEVFATWQESIRTVAQNPNVYVKLGGLGMKVNGFDFHLQPSPPTSDDLAKVWRPYFETCIESFGVDRCMFESNFPVDKISGSYTTYWNTFKKIAAGASADEKASLFCNTAAEFYRLNVAAYPS